MAEDNKERQLEHAHEQIDYYIKANRQLKIDNKDLRAYIYELQKKLHKLNGDK